MLVLAIGMMAFESIAQDTVVVQTLTFDSTWTRRGKWLFPPATQKFRKALMYYTLKCYPNVSGDGKYPCGEWDYLAYANVYDNRGKLDSTYKSNYNYTVAGNTPATFAYKTTPVFDLRQTYKHNKRITGITSMDSALVGGSNLTTNKVTGNGMQEARSLFIWKASDLATNGLQAGNITGIRLNLMNSLTGTHHIIIKMKQVTADTVGNTFPTGMTLVYDFARSNDQAGWISFPFLNAFNWDGTSNIAIEISTRKRTPDATDAVFAASASGIANCLHINSNGYCIETKYAGDYVDLGTLFQVKGNAPRTYDMWAFVSAFNDAGIFQAGQSGTDGKDFSLRTSSTNNAWRGQMWGTADFDMTLNGSLGSWHHYAMTYDGSVARVYYDGVLAATKSAGINTGDANVWLARWTSSYLQGRLVNFRAWNKALSATKIKEIMTQDEAFGTTDYASIIASYPLNEGTGSFVYDNVKNNNPVGQIYGNTQWRTIAADELFYGTLRSEVQPQIIFEKAVFTYEDDSVAFTDTLNRFPVQLVKYDNPAPNKQVADNAANHPSIATATLNVWEAGWSYTYNGQGQKIDSVMITPDESLTLTKKEWYSPQVTYEIGRYITPYGINLSLGNGYRWVYDVTDYLSVLQDSVELSAGDGQELIDLKFILIKGEPAAEVLHINQVWNKGSASYSYRSLSNDTEMASKKVPVHPDADFVKMKMRITGHGHNSNTGNFPHCCEWKDNTHYLYANNTKAAEWKIFQYTECAENPLYPQGGTWPGAREGWCPGDVVKDKDIDLTSYATGDSMTVDYQIDPVPSNNLGMGDGNYVMAAQLIEYKKADRENDAELYEVIRPSNVEAYSRKNPICFAPTVVIRNAGKNALTHAQIQYQVAGGPARVYDWVGTLNFQEKATVELPLWGADFWVGSGLNTFTATIIQANRQTDAYTGNNVATSSFNMPDIYNESFVVFFKTNSNPSENAYVVRDPWGNIAYEKKNLAANTIYRDTVLLWPGCYTFEMTDEAQDGLSYWANTAQGSGTLSFRSKSGSTVFKNFNPDFGASIHYAFIIGTINSVQDPNINKGFDVYPNPTTGKFTLEFNEMNEQLKVEVFTISGQVLISENVEAGSFTSKDFNLEAKPGVYFVRVTGSKGASVKKLILQK